MKNLFKTTFLSYTLLLSSIMLVLLSSCRDKEINKITYIGNVPIYMSYSDLRSSIQSEESKEIKISGKIYIYNNYLLINDYLKGIHVFDNSNPSNPIALGFINIPGNIDMSIKNDILYVDSYIDLVALDISDITNVQEIDRAKDIYSYKIPAAENNNYRVAAADENKGVVIGYEIKEVSERTVYENHYLYYNCWTCRDDIFAFDALSTTGISSPITNSVAGNTGLAGSMAGFSQVGDYLYCIDGNDILSISLDKLKLENTVETTRTLETIFPAKGKLFFGTTSGMVIYDLTDPIAPTFFSEFNHAISCDPVVVQGDYAYVTLRTGSACAGWNNQLDVINIADLANPQLVKSVDFHNPHGLGIDGDHLFICDGTAGLKIYDASDISAIESNQLYAYSNITSTDVIPLKEGKTLIMVGKESLIQYDYSDISNVKVLSTINF